ncbi:hypothetical protein SprV_0401607100 [Sparganum proliferum]
MDLRDGIVETRLRLDWFNDDEAISNLLVKENRLQKAYVYRPTDDNRAAFYLSRRLTQHGLHEMQDACNTRKTEEIQGYADRNVWKNFFPRSKLSTVRQPKVLLLPSTPTTAPSSLRGRKFYSHGLNTSEASSTAPSPSTTPPPPTPQDQLQHPGCNSRRLSVHPSLASHASTNVDRPLEPPLPSPSPSPSPSTSSSSSSSSSSSLSSSSSTASTYAAVASAMPTNTTHNPEALLNINASAVNANDEDMVYACPQ